jgi:hypothetical protein
MGKVANGRPAKNVDMSAMLSKKSSLVGLILLEFAMAGPANAASTTPAADIVYSARYYNPGTRPSHYKIWRHNG